MSELSSRRLLEYVGTFREFGFARGASVADLRGKRRGPNKGRVVAYLRAAPTLLLRFGLHQDIFDPTKGAPMHIATDGRFAWHRALAYYVERYDIELPSEFEKHIAANGYDVPFDIVTSDLELPSRA